MTRHPEIQKKAQEEIDSVVGKDRLPTLSDRDSLPYVECVIKEVLRFAAVAALMPHSLDEDDVGFHHSYEYCFIHSHTDIQRLYDP